MADAAHHTAPRKAEGGRRADGPCAAHGTKRCRQPDKNFTSDGHFLSRSKMTEGPDGFSQTCMVFKKIIIREES